MSLSYRIRQSLLKTLILVGLLFPMTVGAQQRVLIVQEAAEVDDRGLYYYVIIEKDTGRVVSQGQMDYGGIDRVILAPETDFFIYSLFTDNLSLAQMEFTTPRVGQRYVIPKLSYSQVEDFDTDGDKLTDLREFIVGTNLFNPDTDGDGIEDGAEIIQGLNPLDGFIVATGVVASGPAEGRIESISVLNNLAMTGSREGHLTVFNVTEGTNPVRIAEMKNLGSRIYDIGSSVDLVAVATQNKGLVVVDITDPPAAYVLHEIGLGTAAHSVAVRGNIAFVGLDSGGIAVCDIVTGTELFRIRETSNRIDDLGILGEYLYALSQGRLDVYRIRGEELEHLSQTSTRTVRGAGARPFRLFVGDTFALVAHSDGYNRISLADPENPVQTNTYDPPEAGWKQIIANGSGLAVAAVSANSTDDGQHNIDLYEIGVGASESTYVGTFQTNGIAAAVEIFNGLAYVADSANGLQVVNYIAYDDQGLPPVIDLTTDAVDGEFEEGKVMTATASVGDDVQVRNVEFYVDGELAVTDGNFPFVYRFVTPNITPEKDSFSLRAVATDTGGNTAEAEEIIILLVPDSTPPYVRTVNPRAGAVTGGVKSITVSFNEPMDTETIAFTPEPTEEEPEPATEYRVSLIYAGEDDLLGTADDVTAPGGMTAYNAETFTAFIRFAEDLEPGVYRIRVDAVVSDVAGNGLEGGTFTSSFRVYGFVDNDRDGVPDDLEPTIGLDPLNRDTDDDGIIDGEEDYDNDNLNNSYEAILGYNPGVEDSDGDGILDGDEDFDGDGLTENLESQYGTDPTKADSDGDNWNDELETVSGTDANDPDDKPSYFVAAQPSVASVLLDLRVSGEGEVTRGTVVAHPSVGMAVIDTSNLASGGDIDRGTVVAAPSLGLVLPDFVQVGGNASDLGRGTVVSRPEVGVSLAHPATGAFELGALERGAVAVSNPVSILLEDIAAAEPPSEISSGTVVAQPEVSIEFEE